MRTAAWSLALVLCLASCSGGGGDQGEGGRGGSAPRDALPDLELTSLDGGEPLRLADLGRGAVVVNLWATWCMPCRKEMPAFDSVAEAVGDDVRIVGVNIGDDAADAQAFVDEVGVDFPQYLDRDGELHAEVGATGMPTTVFVDDGNIVDLHAGALTADELAGEIEKRFGVSISSGDGAEGGGP